MILTKDSSKLLEFGGHVELTPAWAYSLLSQMNFVKRKATTAKSKFSDVEFIHAKGEFLIATEKCLHK